MGMPKDHVRLDQELEGFAQLDKTGRLCVAILNRAALDWWGLIQRRAWLRTPEAMPNFTELQQFFRSQWCTALCLRAGDMTPERMLDILECDLDRAKREQAQGDGPAQEKD